MPPLMCLILKHRYPDWKLQDAATCVHSTACKWCGNEKRQVIHVRGPAVRVDPCHSQQACTRCKEVLSEPEHHDYKPWEYDRDGACTTHKTCRHCGDRKPQPPQHEWSRWQPDRPDTCAGRRTCTRCGEFRDFQISHLAYTWEYDLDGCTGSERCSRCGDTKHPGTKHTYDWQYDRPDRCTGSKQCSRCGDTKDRDTKHQYDSKTVASERTCWRETCERCGKSTDHRHQYGWVYLSNVRRGPGNSNRNLARLRNEGGRGREEKCAQVSVCANCAYVYKDHFQHDHRWKPVQEGKMAYLKCARCGTRQPVSR